MKQRNWVLIFVLTFIMSCDNFVPPSTGGYDSWDDDDDGGDITIIDDDTMITLTTDCFETNDDSTDIAFDLSYTSEHKEDIVCYPGGVTLFSNLGLEKVSYLEEVFILENKYTKDLSSNRHGIIFAGDGFFGDDVFEFIWLVIAFEGDHKGRFYAGVRTKDGIYKPLNLSVKKTTLQWNDQARNELYIEKGSEPDKSFKLFFNGILVTEFETDTEFHGTGCGYLVEVSDDEIVALQEENGYCIDLKLDHRPKD